MLQVGPVVERICGCRVTLHRRYDIALQLPTVAHQALIGGSFESVVIDAAMAQSQSVPQFVRQRAPLRTGRSQQAVGSFEWDIGGSAEGDHQIVSGQRISVRVGINEDLRKSGGAAEGAGEVGIGGPSPVELEGSWVELLIDDLILAGACAAGNLDYVALPDDSVVVFGKRRKRGQGAQRGGPRGSNFPAIRAAGILTGFVVIREDGIVEDQFPGILVLGSEVVVLHVLERPRTDSRYGQRIRLAEINEVREPGAAVAGEADLAAAVEGPGAHVDGEGTAGLVLARPAVDMQGDPLGNRRWSGAVDAHTVVIARKRGRVIEHTLKR